ncbi:MAG: DUF3035 domain-containing protein [Pseudomonadota bacterium]
MLSRRSSVVLEKSPRLGLACLAMLSCLGGCGFGRAFSDGKNPPDEFAVVTKAPLVVPPDYSLRPPKPGETRPQEQSASKRAQAALLGDVMVEPQSFGEQVLVQRAGGQFANADIRGLLASENGARAEKDGGFANQLMFWEFFGDDVDDSKAPLQAENPEVWFAQRERSIKAVIGEEGQVEIGGGDALALPGVR